MKALSKGFADVVTALNNNKQALTPEIAGVINNYSKNVADLAKATNRLSGKFDMKEIIVDTSALVLKPVQPQEPPLQAKQTPISQEEKIDIPVGDNTAKRVSPKCQNAIVKELDDNGRLGVLINMNGGLSRTYPGDKKIAQSDANDATYYLVYDGKINDHFAFRVTRQ